MDMRMVVADSVMSVYSDIAIWKVSQDKLDAILGMTCLISNNYM